MWNCHFCKTETTGHAGTLSLCGRCRDTDTVQHLLNGLPTVLHYEHGRPLSAPDKDFKYLAEHDRTFQVQSAIDGELVENGVMKRKVAFFLAGRWWAATVKPEYVGPVMFFASSVPQYYTSQVN